MTTIDRVRFTLGYGSPEDDMRHLLNTVRRVAVRGAQLHLQPEWDITDLYVTQAIHHADTHLEYVEWWETEHDVDGVDTYAMTAVHVDIYLPRHLARAVTIGAFLLAEQEDITPIDDIFRSEYLDGEWQPQFEPELAAHIDDTRNNAR